MSDPRELRACALPTISHDVDPTSESELALSSLEMLDHPIMLAESGSRMSHLMPAVDRGCSTHSNDPCAC
eukprot:1621902-Pleurochrysis_carterae.AAC.2